MQRGDYKSILHYLTLQSGHSGLSFEDFLLYFTNKDIGKLDLAISETILRDAFHKRLGSFYNSNIITCIFEFKMIVKRNLSIEICDAPNVFIGNYSYLLNLGMFDFVMDNEEAEHLLSQLLENSPQLTKICFKFITVKGLSLIAHHCGPALRTMNTEIDDNSLKAIQSMCRACPNLRALSLRCIGAEPNGDDLILTAMQHCPSIEVLPSLRYITDIAMNALATIHTLKHLSIPSDDCTSSAVQKVLRANPNLADIFLLSQNDALVNCIGRYCGNLKRLTIGREFPPPISNGSLVEVFRGCPLLEYFNLHQRSGGMSNVALKAMFEFCPHLTEFELFSVELTEQPSPAGEPVIYKSYPSLLKLWLMCGGVSTSAFRDIFTHCTNLQVVHLDSCDQITDETIRVMAQSCTSLNTLHVMSCKNVTVAGLLEVASHCTSLMELLLYRMPINDEALVQLSLHCPSLTNLSLMSCMDGLLTEAGILAMLERCTRLTFLLISRDMLEAFLPTLDLTKLRQLYPHIQFKISS